ncbi:MAG: type II toxin-antitoxin system VapC family toxin [Aeromicrobium sp.]|nr:type II toxin-antitoxin system VapC family toxin [Burkholderiales bacterium]
MILLDTHTLLWSQFQPQKLGPKSRALIDKHWDRGEIAIPAIAFWEVGMLISRGRFDLKVGLREWRAALLQGGARELSIDGEVAVRAAELAGLHPDPADRFIAATALAHNATLMTADEKLLAWRHTLERHDARQ